MVYVFIRIQSNSKNHEIRQLYSLSSVEEALFEYLINEGMSSDFALTRLRFLHHDLDQLPRETASYSGGKGPSRSVVSGRV